MPREDVTCPHCPPGLDRFELHDVGMKIVTDDWAKSADRLTVRMAAPAWQPVFLMHLRAAHPQQYGEVAVEILNHLLTTGQLEGLLQREAGEMLARVTGSLFDPIAERANRQAEAGL